MSANHPLSLLPYFQLSSIDPRWAVARQKIEALQARGALLPTPESGDEIYFRQHQQEAEYWVLRVVDSVDEHAALYGGLPEWSLAHVSAAGKRSAVRRQVNPTNAISVPIPVGAFDYEDDGVTELLTLTQCTSDASGSLYNVGKIWTLAQNKMVESDLAAGYEVAGFVDQDRDGRPDIIFDPYGVWLDNGVNYYQRRLGGLFWHILFPAEHSAIATRLLATMLNGFVQKSHRQLVFSSRRWSAGRQRSIAWLSTRLRVTRTANGSPCFRRVGWATPVVARGPHPEPEARSFAGLQRCCFQG